MRRNILLITAALVITGSSAQEWAKARFENSPRHLDYVTVKHGNREVKCFIAYPEVKEKATAVIVIHEIFGLSDWARNVTDELAAAGYIAIAPDLLSGAAPGGGGTKELGDRDAITRAIRTLPIPQITADLNAVAEYVTALPACNGKIAVGGFCWGGGQTFRYATANKNLKAAFVFYGPGPENESDLTKIGCPVYGFYAGNDARITESVPTTEKQMKKSAKTFEPVIYEGAGHGFMRAGEDPNDTNPANKKAHDEAWARWKTLLKKL